MSGIRTEYHSTPNLWVAFPADACCCPECNPPVGHGRTEQAAIDDLINQMAESA